MAGFFPVPTALIPVVLALVLELDLAFDVKWEAEAGLASLFEAAPTFGFGRALLTELDGAGLDSLETPGRGDGSLFEADSCFVFALGPEAEVMDKVVPI